MWTVLGNELFMCEGDWGVELPIPLIGVTLTANDAIRFTLKIGEETITKDFTNISQNTFYLEFTEEEAAAIPVGVYQYSLDWYQNGAFLCNLIPSAVLRVVDKA